jgi:NADPH-dependent curcumin reductase CurA
MTVNRRILLVQRPVEMFTDACFEVVEAEIPEPADGEVMCRGASTGKLVVKL